MTDFTRLTIVGSTRRATVVVPSDEPVGALLPRLVELLDEPVTSVARPLTLVRLTGEQLEATTSCAEQGVGDGEVLRLLRLDEAPPPPEVSDVTDTVSETLAGRAGLWSAGHRTVLGAVAVGGLALVAGSVAGVEPGALLAAWAVVAIAAGLAGLAGRVPVARILLGAAIGLTVPTALALAPFARYGVIDGSLTVVTTLEQERVDTIAYPLAIGLALVWLTLLVGVGLGRRSRAAALGTGVGALGGLVALAVLIAGLDPAQTAALLAAAAVVATGLLPWYAMSASGLTGLDDQVMAGRLAERTGVLATVGDAYRTLTWATFAVASLLGASLAGLVWSRDPWLSAVAGVVVLVTALRTRAFPLAAQGWALWVAALVPLILGGLWRSDVGPAGTAPWLLAAVIVTALLAVARPAAHQRAALRRLGNVVESLGVVALIPLLLGAFGVYTELLGSFS